MQILKFPTTRERTNKKLKAMLEDNTDAFDDDIKAELIKDIMSYVDLLDNDELDTVSLYGCEPLTEDQQKSVEEAFHKFSAEIISIVVGIILPLRLEKAVSQMTY